MLAIGLLPTGVGITQGLLVRHAPQTQAEMHLRVVSLYDFHPSRISDADRKAKSQEMDLFWDEMKAAPDATLPLLRKELLDDSDPSFFFTDGTELLLSLSKTRADRDLAAGTLLRVDLSDTQSGAYFNDVHRLATEDINVTSAALHILDNPAFRVSVPQHAMVLDLRMSLMYILLSMREELWVKSAGERFANERNTDAKLALIFALSYAQTDEADAQLRRIASDNSQPEIVRKKTQEVLDAAQKTEKSWMPIKGTIPQIREQRRQRLKSVSDEAIDDVQWMTRRIAQLRAKGKG